jgi:hypothetical protein
MTIPTFQVEPILMTATVIPVTGGSTDYEEEIESIQEQQVRASTLPYYLHTRQLCAYTFLVTSRHVASNLGSFSTSSCRSS